MAQFKLAKGSRGALIKKKKRTKEHFTQIVPGTKPQDLRKAGWLCMRTPQMDMHHS